ncbi:hypothetical protein ACN42_g6790 [Penicillium freii]|uniref:GST N-terminal domain-containing protein n=1 Tax=Penicillium freii TaxID=48697 RepID=A0A117NN72_PENFR|nr:hypothetical protein ACN42_g6790 [Penicillium freii]
MSSNITLYTWSTANGIKASITLEELGLPYKTEGIDISSSSNPQKEEWFLKINPNGRIPALLDGSQRVFESGAIMTYLVDKYDTERKISYAPGTPEHVEQTSWLMFQMAGLGPMQGQANHFRLFANTRSDYAIQRAPVSLEIDLSEFPAVKKWVEEIDKRAAVQKGVDVPHAMTPEQKAEIFRNFRAKIDAMTTSDQH